jgi:hypothetical protein
MGMYITSIHINTQFIYRVRSKNKVQHQQALAVWNVDFLFVGWNLNRFQE